MPERHGAAYSVTSKREGGQAGHFQRRQATEVYENADFSRPRGEELTPFSQPPPSAPLEPRYGEAFERTVNPETDLGFPSIEKGGASYRVKSSRGHDPLYNQQTTHAAGKFKPLGSARNRKR